MTRPVATERRQHERAHALLGQGVGVEDVAYRLCLTVPTVARIARETDHGRLPLGDGLIEVSLRVPPKVHAELAAEARSRGIGVSTFTAMLLGRATRHRLIPAIMDDEAV